MLDINNGKASRFEIVHDKPVKNVIGTMNSGNNCQYVSNNPNNGNQSPFNVVAQNMTKEKQKKEQKEERNITNIFVIETKTFFHLRRFSQESASTTQSQRYQMIRKYDSYR